jgi:hypothetical protein
VSISPTSYEQLFHTKAIRAAFFLLDGWFNTLLAQENWWKKLLVKLNVGVSFTSKSFTNSFSVNFCK